MENKSVKYQPNTRALAWCLLVIFVSSLVSPTYTLAGGGGPTQPEVQGFTPMGVSDMVDPFTGDFTYNIPLMDVEGFPINIAYNSGVTMDQEASWVGLGWNLNIGSVVRNLRGLPDDFSGDEVVKEVNQKPNTTIGVDMGGKMEIFGFDGLGNIIGQVAGDGTEETSLDLQLGLSVSYNNYNGWASQFSIGPSFNFGKSGGLSGTAGFSLSGSSENGASFAPSLSFDSKTKKNTGKDKDMSTTIGAGMNSRAGLQAISYSNTINRKITASTNKAAKGHYDQGSVGGSYNMGLQTYSPSSGPSMFGLSLSGSFNMGLDGWGIDGQLNGGISFSRQWIPDHWKTIKSPAYGYFTLNSGQSNDKALLDFNRDDDGSFTKYSRSLPSTYLTYDIFTVQAQGTSGSFRGFRNEVGYVFDPRVFNSDAGGSVGLELGFGAVTDIGVDVQLSYTASHSGRWSHRNEADDLLKFQDTKAGELVGAYSMQEANERMVDTDNLIISSFGSTNQSYFPLSGGFAGTTKLKDKLNNVPGGSLDLGENQRSSRIQTNNLMSFLSISDVNNDLGVGPIPTNLSSNAEGHHIGEITQLGTDGRRYVFGIAAYNNTQKDVTFAIGKKIDGDAGYMPSDDYSGLVTYPSGSVSSLVGLSNDYGIDNYYSSTTTPAYAHAFMLTSVLGEDYVDSDTIKGPSDNDLGAYVKIDYQKVDNHQWRTPIQENTAYFNEGMKTDFTDEKASYVYGEKELWYVKGIETKNYVAVFVLEPRKDGRSANGEQGGISSNDATSMKLLRKIILYSKPDYKAHIGNLSQATPIKEITFEYDYHLCKDYPGNSNTDVNDNGKLTLKEIKFTYQGSNKMKNRSYKFNYGGLNPNYNLKAVDRWGTFKPTLSGIENPLSPIMTNSDFPYTIQDTTLTNQYVAAWDLTDITLPTGGKIKVEYESDDYGFVQHLPAARMFKIVAVDQENEIPLEGLDGSVHYQNVSVDNIGSLEKNKAFLFKLDNATDDINDYATLGQQLYFRVLMDFRNGLDPSEKGKSEYVSGYAKIIELSTVPIGNEVYGRIRLEPEKLTDIGGADYSPITKAALQFGRIHLSQYIFELGGAQDIDGSEQGFMDFLNSLASSITSMGEMFTGPNKAIYNKDRGVNIAVNKSFIRLMEPTGKKLGGGSRVRRITMSDSWGDMTTGNSAKNYSYGQEFIYELENGKSSGVASYEPQIGGDENPWHTAYIVNNKKRFALDDNLFIEDPIMESQFPSPSVGYSRVVIKDLPRSGVKKTATGKVVKEFYTARDFPTIVKRSEVDLTTANSFLPLLPTYQYLTASQGFVIELNDMHGKPKKESVYAENKSMPLSTVEYIYQTTELALGGLSNKKLVNTATVINPDGSTSIAEIGVKYDAVADFRESQTNSMSGKIAINTNGLLFGFLPVIIPTVYPSMDMSESRFRSATLNKTIYRFGIMNKMIANQDGSIVETNNLAYDSRTGEILSTQTTTDFNDSVYSMNYPAYWKYRELGQASQNIGYSYKVSSTASNGFAMIPQSANFFSEGDEVRIMSVLNLFQTIKAWVVEKNNSGIRLIDKQGNPILIQNALVTVIRSGYINRQSESMASLTSLDTPIGGLQTGNYTNVLNAGAIEFSDNWNTSCECFNTPKTATSNPFVNGTRGNFRPVRSYTHLSGRTQQDYDNNTNIRRDGVFTSYSPYYKFSQGQWLAQGQNWTFVSEVTEFSPNGMTLESRDALGRYSSSLYSFNNTMATAVAANAQLKQLAFGSFEDVEYTNCMDNSFFKTVPTENISTAQAHSGRTSVKVPAGNILTISNTVSTCNSEDMCNMTLASTAMTGIAQINNGTGPYNLTSEVISGEIDAQLNNDNTITLTLPAGSNVFEIIITLTDSTGCKVRYLVSGTKSSYTYSIISTNQD